MKRDDNDIIFKPRPLRGFGRKRTLYIPVDSPRNTIRKALKKYSIKEKKDPLGHLFLLKNQAVLYMTVGAPSAVISLERLIASGTDQILILGFCGALKEEAEIADPVIITRAFSEEGTSKLYIPGRKIFRPSMPLRRDIEQILRNRGLLYSTGFIVSTDAPFRETKSWLNRNREKGIGFVDMEASAVFALAEFHHIEAAALMLVSDNLSAEKHGLHMRNAALLTNIKKYFFPFFE